MSKRQPQQPQQKQTNIAALLSGVVMGAVVGGVAAWLLAPQSGPQLRALVLGRGQALKASTEHAIQEAQHTVHIRMEQAKTTIGVVPPNQSDGAEVV
jgi:gas vesicle protein